jgi:hypothetical protein
MDFLLNVVMSNPYVPWIAGAAVLLYAYQKLAPRLRIRVPGSAITLDGVMGKLLGSRYAEAKADKAVSRYKKSGNYLAAGRTYEETGKLAEAVEAYSEGKEFWAAASVLERMGKGKPETTGKRGRSSARSASRPRPPRSSRRRATTWRRPVSTASPGCGTRRRSST